MSKYFFLINFFFTFYVYGTTIKYKDLTVVNGVYYIGNDKNLFTGETTGSVKGKFVNGKKVGTFFKYYENGQLLSIDFMDM